MGKEIKAFSFYKSYYDALQQLDEEDQREIVFAIINYIFEDKEPRFKDRDIKKMVWILLLPNLEKSKNRSNQNAGAPVGNQNAKKDENEKQSKNNQTPLDISYSYSFINIHISSIIINNQNHKNNIHNLFKEYIQLREDNKYTINETVVKRLVAKLNEYGDSDENKVKVIENAINGKWKDFYELGKEKKAVEVKYETV